MVGIAEHNHDVIAHEGIGKLGGDDFDEIILSLALEQMGLGQENLTASNKARLLEECRERKEGLKSNTKKMVVDPGMVLQIKNRWSLTRGWSMNDAASHRTQLEYPPECPARH